jgi:DNA-binding MarR family transcriptional regulator
MAARRSATPGPLRELAPPAALEGEASAPALVSSGDAALERALEELFRLGANKRFNQHQAIAVGAVVTRAGYAALRSLYDHGSLSVRGLADACAMDAATASRQLMPLVDGGLVERGAADGDARQVVLRLTAEGRAVYERIVAYRLDQLTGVLDAWSEEDRDRLTELASRLARDLARLPRESSGRGPRASRRGPRAVAVEPEESG